MSEEIGPQNPAHLRNEERASVPEIGPQLCDSIERSSKHDSEVSEDTPIDPMLPQGRALPNYKKRVIGPAVMPPPGYSHQEEKEEEDIIGPILPKGFKEGSDDSNLQKTIQEFEERAEKMRKALEPNDQGDKPLQRGEWMLVPPETKFLGETPTNMRSRQFKKKTQDPSNSDNSLWTETPAEREERLKKQATSNQKRKHAKDEDDEPIKYTRIDLETAEKVKEYNELYRPKSLLETHSENYVKSRKWQDDDASKRSFDREKDVLGTRRMDSRKRKEFLDNAKGLGSKFGHGKHGSFL
ncbi:unnamed protein product [Rhizophagus irregularis]|uniref:DUF3752 domain-containing protein n=1 Tax=Rhizophagus irregularis TaxID=588596 RepID=A0A2N1NZ83_9GLOM|nr:hypothetical protein RhiirC2_769411 [Rhizophagus irregularis]CAB4378167.1 unnamed protein product [Rhizophagus irregularis]CAB5330191.1 unnamed protein product [Rhizophagus irregularis]